ncbi:GTP-binding protein REM 1-like [Schistocerca piceifrons]|uniref:GTP-binding protein REM 1-like n=1 Tax=Schistocerca piceifrons TaxID=274613 RepID=UPI001F5E41B8|nr:GTP-binding protein REM 1-like [Schistocerca piceifrons]
MWNKYGELQLMTFLLVADEEFGQKTVSVMLDGREAELEIVDHPASEMSVESYCTTYNPDVFVVVYSVVDRKTLKAAEDILLFLWKNDYVASRGVILVGNKADLERRREVPMAVIDLNASRGLPYQEDLTCQGQGNAGDFLRE